MPIPTTDCWTSIGIEDVLAILETALNPEELSEIQELIVRQVWQGKTYAQIAEQAGYNPDYIKSVGSQLWHWFSDVLGESVTKRNFRSLIKRRVTQEQGYRNSLVKEYPGDFQVINHQSFPTHDPSLMKNYQDWGEVIDTSHFFGRIDELTTLDQWIVQDKCRLVSILGLGGVGKTALAAHYVQQLQNEFEYLIWRSLRNSPPLEELLADWLQFLSQEQETNLSDNTRSKISRLMSYLRQHRCLLIVDNWESILRSSKELEGLGKSLCLGRYRPGYEGYEQLLQRVGEEHHQSCLLLTSREKPIGLASKEGDSLPVRCLRLKGLGLAEEQEIFSATGLFSSNPAFSELIEHYSSNPLVLKIVATMIRELFDGNVSQFLAQGTFIFGEISDLLDQQFERLSTLEQQVVYRLAIYREGVSLEQLQKDLNESMSSRQLLAALEALKSRSLVEVRDSQLMLPNLILEYVRELRLQSLLVTQSMAQNPGLKGQGLNSKCHLQPSNN